MIINLELFNIIISVALLIVSITPVVLVYLLLVGWKQKDLW